MNLTPYRPHRPQTMGQGPPYASSRREVVQVDLGAGSSPPYAGGSIPSVPFNPRTGGRVEAPLGARRPAGDRAAAEVGRQTGKLPLTPVFMTPVFTLATTGLPASLIRCPESGVLS